MPINNENIVGAVNELLELFKKQQAITNHALNSNQIDNSSLNKEREKIEKINAEFEFISHFILENISVEDNHRYIGKMLLNARQQAEDILKEAHAEAAKLKPENEKKVTKKVVEEPEDLTEPPVIEAEVVEEEQAVVVEEVVMPKEVLKETPVEVTELSANHLHKTKEIHQKYKDSLDSILKEIDVFLER